MANFPNLFRTSPGTQDIVQHIDQPSLDFLFGLCQHDYRRWTKRPNHAPRRRKMDTWRCSANIGSFPPRRTLVIWMRMDVYASHAIVRAIVASMPSHRKHGESRAIDIRNTIVATKYLVDCLVCIRIRKTMALSCPFFILFIFFAGAH